MRSKPFVKDDGTVYAWSFDWKLYAINQFANPKNYRDRLITYNSGSVGGVPVVVDNTDDWLKGAPPKAPGQYAWRSIEANPHPEGRIHIIQNLAAPMQPARLQRCSRDLLRGHPDQLFARHPHARPAQLEQTINLLPSDHQDFERFLFGFTSQTASGETQSATIREFQLSFIRLGDPNVTNDPNWP